MTKLLRNSRVFTQTRPGFPWFELYQAAMGGLRAAAADQAAYSTLRNPPPRDATPRIDDLEAGD
jgi:hypothetical protein